MSSGSLLLVAGRSHPDLAHEVSDLLGLQLTPASLTEFPDGELSVRLEEPVKGRHVSILQSIALDPNRYLFELLLLVDAARRGGALSVTAVVPYFGYSRQDRSDQPGVPISAKLIANLLSTAGISRLITCDLHADQLEGFFDVPVHHIRTQPLLLEALRPHLPPTTIVVAPDTGSIKHAETWARALGTKLAVIQKERTSATTTTMRLIGNVTGKCALLADDLCSTATTLVQAAHLCHAQGASKVVAVAAHGLCVGEALARIDASPLEGLYTTDTVPMRNRSAPCPKVQVVPIAPLIATALRAGGTNGTGDGVTTCEARLILKEKEYARGGTRTPTSCLTTTSK